MVEDIVKGKFCKEMAAGSNPIEDLRISSIASNKVLRAMLKLFDPLNERILGLDKIKLMYRGLHGLEDSQLIEDLFKYLNTTIRVRQNELEAIPKTGPVIVVANHPYGGIDGIILYNLLQKIRPDFKIMANKVLKTVPEFSENFIGVDVFDSGSPQNRASVKEALKHLKDDGILALFPAGEVSRYEFRKKKVTDCKWSNSFARFARMSDAAIVPIHFSGNNGLFFQLAGIVHPMLRTVLLPRQLMKRDRKVHVTIGTPVKAREVKQFANADVLRDFVRLKTYLLRRRPKDLIKKRSENKKITELEPIISETTKKYLINDIENLSAENHLIDHKDFSVYYGGVENFPNILREIGRLREITFREVGEGSGKSCDLDQFDETYKHIVVWNNVNQDIVGSYRFAVVDEIMQEHGVKGLYTSSFYKFSDSFQDKIRNGLELGRSFVRKEYQKQYVPLLLLWKGICRFITNNPRYHFIFGAVSVSSSYDEKSRFLISNLLMSKNTEVTARKKYECRLRSDPDVKAVCRNLEIDGLDLLSNLIKTVEKDKDIPILLKQYMKLGGQFYSFTVDNDFNNCLDGLIVVDLKKSPKKTLKLYMDDNIDEYLSFHGL